MPRGWLLGASVGGLGLVLAGCAGPVTPIAPDVDATGMPNSEVALQRSMDRADAAMRDLGGRSVSYRPVAASPSPAVLPGELQRPETFAWSGPIDTGVKALADRIGYRVVVTAPAQAQPVPVMVNMTDVRVVDLFAALGASAGARATVVVDPDRRLVQVQHHV